jgi:molybdopterin converting factor small subunit
VTSTPEHEELRMNVRLYGRLADLLGEQVQLDLAGCSVGKVRTAMAERHPAARAEILSQRVRACVGDMIVGEEHVVSEADVIEFFPPVSGG